MKFLKRLAAWWDGWVGDRDLEIAIRGAINDLGLRGGSARLSNVRLVAVQRPGWRQIFCFDAAVNVGTIDVPSLRSYYGLLLQDERYRKTDIRVFEVPIERLELLDQWAEGMLRLRNVK